MREGTRGESEQEQESGISSSIEALHIQTVEWTGQLLIAYHTHAQAAQS